MADVAFVNVGTKAQWGSGTTGTPGAPASPANGNIWLMAAAVPSDLTPTVHADWTLVGSHNFDTITVWAWWYRYSGSGPTNRTITTASSTKNRCAGIAQWSGCKASGSPIGEATNTFEGENAFSTGDLASLSLDDAVTVMVVQCLGFNDDIFVISYDGGYTAAFDDDPEGPTGVYQGFSGSPDSSLGLVYKTVAGPDEVDAEEFVLDIGGTVDYAVFAFCLLPDAPLPLAITIDSPADGALFELGSAGDFEGAATSPVDGDVSADIEWSSDVDGPLGTGATVPLSSLTTPGPHVITASIEDSALETDEASITVHAYSEEDWEALVDCFDGVSLDTEKWRAVGINFSDLPVADVEGGAAWIRHRTDDISGTNGLHTRSFYDFTAADAHVAVGLGIEYTVGTPSASAGRELRLLWSDAPWSEVAYKTVLLVHFATASSNVLFHYFTYAGGPPVSHEFVTIAVDWRDFPYWDLIHDGAGTWSLFYSANGYEWIDTGETLTPDNDIDPLDVEIALVGIATGVAEGANDHSFTGVNCLPSAPPVLLPPTALFDLLASPSLAQTTNNSFANEPGATIVASAWAYWLADAPETILGTSTEENPDFVLNPNVPGILTFRLIVTDSNGLTSAPYYRSSIFGRGDGGDGMTPSGTDICTMDWTLYEGDGVTIRAQSSSSSTWLGQTSLAKPYLREPSGYGEQEVDFANGTASIGQVNIRNVDVRQIAGDQDSGWFTELLPHVAGNRNRLRRYTPSGWVVIADGPGSFPQLSETFAGFTHEIRDTREKERRLKAFEKSEGIAAIPPGVIDGYGAYGDGLFVSPAVEPITAAYQTFGFLDYRQNWPDEDETETPPDELLITALAITAATPTKVETIGTAPVIVEEEPVQFPNFRRTFGNMRWRWREVGDTEWRYTGTPVIESTDTPIGTIFDYTGEANANGLYRTVTGVLFVREDGTEVPNGTNVEVYLEYRGPVSEEFPLLIEGLTAGEFLQNLYDGVYSPRDAISGDIVSTGIRYDEAALLAMDIPVRLRITESVKDIRKWAEENIYKPLGFAPALDNDGEVSPVSQEIPSAPAILNALTVIDNAITQGVPGHAPGDNVINLLTFKYPRVYLDLDREETEDLPAYSGSKAADHLSVQDVTNVEFDPYSTDRFGERGDPGIETSALVGLGAGKWVGNKLRGVDSVEEQEEGATQFFQRFQNLFQRRVLGTDLVVAPVMRAYTAALRVGDWVRCQLSWIPNQDTGRRGVDHLAQIFAIGETNCAWRMFSMELVRPFDEAFNYNDPYYGLDEYGNFDPAFLLFSITPEPPVDNSEFVTVRAQSNVAPEGYRWKLFATTETELIGGGDLEPFGEHEITLYLNPPAAFEPLPTTDTVYEYPSGYQRSESIPTRVVRQNYRVEVWDTGRNVLVYNSGPYPFDNEWTYVE